MIHNLDANGHPIPPLVIFYRLCRCWFPMFIPYVNDWIAERMEEVSGIPASEWFRVQSEYVHWARAQEAAKA